MGRYLSKTPPAPDCWRGIVLFGRNVASYKFALAQALLDLHPAGGTLVKLGDLAVPFASRICQHLRLADKQGTSRSSRFLAACRQANEGVISQNTLIDRTVQYGFNNVIDAFHVVGQETIPLKFFSDERQTHEGIRISDEFSLLLESPQAANLPHETEARWRLVETAWALGVNRALVRVEYDIAGESLFTVDATKRRQNITKARSALNGYQKGRCFYCFEDMALEGEGSPDVDHFFPHTLKASELPGLIDGVWNLVLACRRCNRGPKGKFDRIPSRPLLERLHRRNEYLISSHHPLRETLMLQTGMTVADRLDFLAQFHSRAKQLLFHEWSVQAVGDPTF